MINEKFEMKYLNEQHELEWKKMVKEFFYFKKKVESTDQRNYLEQNKYEIDDRISEYLLDEFTMILGKFRKYNQKK